MNLKRTISFLLPASAILLLLACGGGSQIVDTPTPEAKVVAKAEVESSPTKEPPKREPTNPSTPTEVPLTVVPTAKPPTSTPTPTQLPPTATPVPPTSTPMPTQVPPTATPTQVPPTATPTQVPPTATPTQVPPAATATPTSIPTLKSIGGAAKERLISIGYNVPGKGTVTEVNQEYVGGVNLDPGYKERFLEIQNSLNSVLGGYPNYIYLVFDPTGTEEDAKPLFDRLEEIQYKPGVLWSIEELNKYLSCLSGSDPGGRRTSTTNPYSICLESLKKIYAYRYKPGPPTATNYAGLALHYAHEYFHHYQKVHTLERGLSHTYFGSESAESTVQAPPWWIEGAAVAFQNAWYKSNWQSLSFLEGEPYESDTDASTTDVNVSIGDVATAKAYKNARQMVMGTLPEDQMRGGCTADWSMTVIEEERSTWTGCDAALVAVSYLAYLTSWKTVWIDIPQDYYDLGFWGAFEKHVGMTNQEFYDGYNAFLSAGDPEDDPPAGWIPPEGPISAYADFWKIAPESD